MAQAGGVSAADSRRLMPKPCGGHEPVKCMNEGVLAVVPPGTQGEGLAVGHSTLCAAHAEGGNHRRKQHAYRAAAHAICDFLCRWV